MREHKIGSLLYKSCLTFEWKKIQIPDVVQTTLTFALEYKNKETVHPFFIIVSSI